MRGRLALLAVAILVLSGCSAPAPAATSSTAAHATGIEADLIVPGHWSINGNVDGILAWVHNNGPYDVPYTWNLTLPGGAPLPAGWSFKALPPQATLKPAGSRTTQGRGYSYGDWHRGLLELTIPGDQPAGLYPAELHVGNTTKAIELLVHPTRGTVAAFGDEVIVDWVGRFRDDGTEFARNRTDARLGAGELLPGFEGGIVGLGLGETVTIAVPPAFGYGYDVPDDNEYAPFSGRWLEYDITLVRFA